MSLIRLCVNGNFLQHFSYGLRFNFHFLNQTKIGLKKVQFSLGADVAAQFQWNNNCCYRRKTPGDQANGKCFYECLWLMFMWVWFGFGYLYEYIILRSLLRISTDVKQRPSVSHVFCGQSLQWHLNCPGRQRNGNRAWWMQSNAGIKTNDMKLVDENQLVKLRSKVRANLSTYKRFLCPQSEKEVAHFLCSGRKRVENQEKQSFRLLFDKVCFSYETNCLSSKLTLFHRGNKKLHSSITKEFLFFPPSGSASSSWGWQEVHARARR